MRWGKAAAVVAMCSLPCTVVHADVVWNQEFTDGDTSGWSDGGGYGSITAVDNVGTTNDYAIVTQTSAGPYSFFDGSRDTWNPWTASIDIFLSPGAWADGEGFDYSVTSYNQSDSHLRDFIFHVTQDTSTGLLLVGGSNNTNFDPIENLEAGNHYVIDAADWYTFEHDFYDAGDGSLAVDMNLYDSLGNLLFTETRNNAADLLATIVGGNGYSWFTNIDVAGGIMIDNHMLAVVPIPPAAALGFLGFGLLALRRKAIQTT